MIKKRKSYYDFYKIKGIFIGLLYYQFKKQKNYTSKLLLSLCN